MQAQKRAERILEVPLSVSVKSGESLRRSGITDLFGIADHVPALAVVQNTGPIHTGFRIRRIGNEPNIPTFEPAVGLFVDQAYRSRSGFAAGDLFDIERIEVLAGPQSTLYGKNTTAGVVHLFTRRPSDRFEAYVDLTGGVIQAPQDAMMSRIEAALGGPVTETTSARLSGVWFDHDPLLDNVFNGLDSGDMARFSTRGQVLFQRDSDLEARLVLEHSQVNDAHTGDPDLDQGVLPALLNDQFDRHCPSPGARDRQICLDQPGTYDLETTHASFEIQRTFAGKRLTAITGWEDYLSVREFDADQLNLPLVTGMGRQRGRGYSQEVRIASESSPVNWMTGLFYLNSRFHEGSSKVPAVTLGPAAAFFRLPGGTGIGQPGDRGFHDARNDVRHFSAFAQGSWRVTDVFKISAGLRWLSERKAASIRNVAEPMTPGLISISLLPVTANGALSRSSEGVAWNIAGQYNRHERMLTYLAISRGFKSGGFNIGFGSTPASDREFGDERVTSFEVGVRGTSANQRLFWNAALFRAEYDDFQSAGWVSLRFQVNNAEQVMVRGAEVDLQAVLSEGLRGSLSVSRADARYERYTGGSCHSARAPDNADGSGCNLSGHDLPLAPEWDASLGLQYLQETRFGHWFSRVHWRWTDQFLTNTTLDPRHVQVAHSRVDLQAGVQWSRYELVAWVRNALDEPVVMQEGPSNLFPRDPAFASFLRPSRSWGLTLRATWQSR